METLHIRCGTDIRGALVEAGFKGKFLEVSDPICRGPVPLEEPLAQIRSRYISKAYLVPEAQIDLRLSRERTGLERARRHERVVLWFEHDSYDQLILARILAQLSDGALPRHLEAVIVDSVPGIERFVGLGMLSPAQLRDLWEVRRPIGAAELAQGRRVWDALRLSHPTALHRLAERGCRAIPEMRPALRRHLQELPWSGDGLSLTQRLVLQAVAAGKETGGAVFLHLHDHSERLPFLGDLMLWADIEELAAAEDPAINFPDREINWPKRPLALTDTGRALLAGAMDWRNCGAEPRWIGGIEIASTTPDWRWSEADDRPVLLG